MIKRNNTQKTYWESIKNGKTYHKKIQLELEFWWPHIFGQFALKIGHFSHELNTTKSHVTHEFTLGDATSSYSNIFAQPHELPIYSKSIDLCIACNLLEFSAYPQQIMHEIDRVLVDDGWLILTHINLFSVLGMQLLTHKIKKIYTDLYNNQTNSNEINNNQIINNSLPYICRLYSSRKINDWLQLLNYEIVCTINLNGKFDKDTDLEKPVNTLNVAQMFGGMRLVIARKRTIPLTHILNKKQSSHNRTQLIPNTLAENVQKNK